MKERFLDDVLSVFRAIDQSIHRVKEPILVTADQLTEGRGLAFPALLDESVLVGAHGDLYVGRRKRLDSSPNASAGSERPFHDGTAPGECQKEDVQED